MTGVGGNGGGRTSERLTITERFTMLDTDTLQYTATIDDPGHVDAALDAVVSVEARAGLRDVRVRVPRGQLRDAQHPERFARRRGEREQVAASARTALLAGEAIVAGDVLHVQAAVDELDAESIEAGELGLGHRDEPLLAAPVHVAHEPAVLRA